jgi:hypothetical protein
MEDLQEQQLPLQLCIGAPMQREELSDPRNRQAAGNQGEQNEDQIWQRTMDRPLPLAPGVVTMPSWASKVSGEMISSYRKPQRRLSLTRCDVTSHQPLEGKLPDQLLPRARWRGASGGVGGGAPAERIPRVTPPPTWRGGAR